MIVSLLNMALSDLLKKGDLIASLDHSKTLDSLRLHTKNGCSIMEYWLYLGNKNFMKDDSDTSLNLFDEALDSVFTQSKAEMDEELSLLLDKYMEDNKLFDFSLDGELSALDEYMISETEANALIDGFNDKYFWGDEDPGTCQCCGVAWELVRPGKSQPNCHCEPKTIFPQEIGYYWTMSGTAPVLSYQILWFDGWCPRCNRNECSRIGHERVFNSDDYVFLEFLGKTPFEVWENPR
jgi:hypothetical protein